MYEGKWKDDKQHGEGMYTDLNGETKRGIWNEGEREKWIG